MLLWLVKFQSNYFPQEMAYKSYEQAIKVMDKFNLPRTKKHLRLIFLEEDENRIPFSSPDNVHM